jgi:uncharacterized phage protein (TIGR01671 family)
MKREIKFRAWHSKAKNWVMKCDIPKCFVEDDDCVVFDAPRHIKLSQYTGLKDANGKEIYEGDILDSGGEDGYLGELVFVAWNQDELQWVVSTEDCDFRDCLRSCFADKSIVWEVVGNIYENPKLLSA